MQVWWGVAASSSPVVVCVCVCVCVCMYLCACVCARVYTYREERGEQWHGGRGGICPSTVDRLAIKGRGLAATNVGVRCGGDGVVSFVQVGVKRFGFCVSGGRRHALGGAGEAGRSPL